VIAACFPRIFARWGSLAVLLLAAAEASIPTAFGLFELDPLSTIELGTLVVTPSSFATLTIPIPADPFFQGQVLPAQSLWLSAPQAELSNLWRVAIL
jgi:hypothetical protein